jgi:hypothetical protein
MHRPSRRELNLGLGTAILAGLLFGGARPRVARAGPPAVAKRLVVFFSPNGTIHPFWRPQGADASFTFPAGSILEPLAPIQQDVVVCDGVDFVGFDNHAPGMRGMLTANGTTGGNTGGMSVDQLIATKLGVKPLGFGVESGMWGANDQTRMSYASPSTYVDPEDDPVQMYQSLFAGANLSPTQAQALLARRKSILDAVTGDLAELRARVSTADQAKLDQHLTALRSTEQGVSSVAGCATPTAPTPVDKWANASFPAIGKAQMDLLVTALACGMTTVASIQWAFTVSPHVLTWAGVTQGHHDLSHSDDSNTAGVQDFVKAERWYASQFTYLVQQLKALPEPGGGTGTMLDNTLVVWVKELGDSRLHDGVSVPFVLAGRAGGFLRTGRYLDFKGTSHQALLVSMCQAMGLDTQAFGDPAVSSGPLPGLS